MAQMEATEAQNIVRLLTDALDASAAAVASAQDGTTVTIAGSESVRNQFIDYAEDGKGKYKSAYPKGTPKKAKSQNILKLIQNVWAKTIAVEDQ